LVRAHNCGAAVLFLPGPDRGGRTAESFYEIRFVHMNTWLCKSARSFANLQIPLHVCITACLFAAGLACMHGGVFMCKGPCIGAERRAGLHASVLLCRAACLFCTSTCTRARFTRSLSGQIGKLNLASGAVVQFTFTDAGELQKIRTRAGKKRVNGISFGNSRIYCAMPKFSGRFSD